METNEMTGKGEEWAETAENLPEHGREYKRRAIEGAREASRTVDSYIHENVWMSVGAAAAVGVLVGFLLGRRD